MDVRPLAKFINERWRVHVKRSMGASAPWTDDPILRTYRFCNVRREDDRVTKWIHSHWLRPHESDQHVWFAMAVARVVNLPESLEAVGYPVPWKAALFKAAMRKRQEAGEKSFTSAYMIRAIEAKDGENKADYLAEYVLTPMWEARRDIAHVMAGRKLKELHERFMEFYGMGSFLAAQIVADVKWLPSMRSASDWATFAAMGPGSQRGMSWVEFGRPNNKYRPTEWGEAIINLRPKLLPKLDRELQEMDAQNLQNCLCEFDKYMRAKSGAGRPKQLFKPSEVPYNDVRV
jgi:hypothetical protein